MAAENMFPESDFQLSDILESDYPLLLSTTGHQVYEDDTKSMLKAILYRLDCLEREVAQMVRQEGRFANIEKELSKQNRLEKIETELGKVAQSTISLAKDLKSFSVDITSQIKHMEGEESVIDGGHTTIISTAFTNLVILYYVNQPIIMASNKMLPPVPSIRDFVTCDLTKVHNPETYAQLLEQENEQLRLRYQQLQLQLQNLEDTLNAQKERERLMKGQVDRYSKELKRRDKIIGEIAETIISEFQRYTQALEHNELGEEIHVYSSFDESPI
ncbi:hypothetical protein VM1G_00662 [Cytospora mali]|uniref:Uncharacterized protein n=1 Tax=Cytospora mali TaxID=578113 RepID=A0A194VMB1_CYTMA|nr:hypothetical protein VM1G_00662 [Valsa mali]